MSNRDTLEFLVEKYLDANSNSKKERVKHQIIEEVRRDPDSAENFLENNVLGDEISNIISTELSLISNERVSEEEDFESSSKPIDFKRNLKIYWNYLRKYKFLFIVTLFLGVFEEVMFLLERYLFGYVIDVLSEYSADELSYNILVNELVIVASIFVLSIILAVISLWLKFHFTIKYTEHIKREMKKDFVSHILKLDHKFHTEHSSGKLVSKLDRGVFSVDAINEIFIFVLMPAIVSFVLVFSSVLYFDFYTALTIFVIVILLLGYNFYLLDRMKKYKVRTNKALDYEKGFISDSLNNIETVKFYSKENYILKKLNHLINNVFSKSFKYSGFYRYFESGDALIIGLGTFFVILFPVLGFLEGDLSIGTITFIYTSYGALIVPIMRFASASRSFYEAMGDMQQLFNYYDIKNKVKDKEGAEDLEVSEGKIEFEDVSFKYDNNEDVIKDFSLTINPKEKVAFVGESGGGKSTIIKLLYRFYDVDGGSIKIDGQDISKVKQESLRDELSIVPQEPILFDDTIYNNIAFSNPSASKKEVFSAIKFAKLDGVINNLPDKENTIVGVRGIKLSGGQKQRVSIARALLANKKILILDEATSALDSKLESEIQRELKNLMKNRTSIVIAHRLSTIMNSDKIVVLDRGKIVAVGTHNELIESCEKYKELWSLQNGGFIPE